MAIGGSTSFQPRVRSRRGRPHPPQVLQGLQSAFRFPRRQEAGPVYGDSAFVHYFLERPPPLTCNLGQAYGLLSVTARRGVSPVSISGERLMFTQSDMDDSNFGVDEHGRTVLMDFSEIGMLPESFVAYTLSLDKKFDPIAASLGLSGNSNLASMAAISSCLWITANPKLGTSTRA
jgi:hypothetical protein